MGGFRDGSGDFQHPRALKLPRAGSGNADAQFRQGQLKRGKYKTGHFDAALVEGCLRLIQQWRPAPPPEWVTCIPSRRHPELVPAFAAQLAAALNLPFVPALEKVLDTAEQKAMQNSSQQARNLDGSLAILGSIPTGPCLLVDDMVDSRWTFTVAA